MACHYTSHLSSIMIIWRFHVKQVKYIKHNGKFYRQVKVSETQTGVTEISQEEYKNSVSASTKKVILSSLTEVPIVDKPPRVGKKSKKKSSKKQSPSTKAK